MNNRFIDPSTIRKNKIVDNNLTTIDGFPIFSIIEFNIAGNCNRSCGFCPVSNPDVYERTKDVMDVELYSKIIDDLQSIEYDGKLLYSAFSEPLLHKDVEKLITITREKLPNARIEMVSNGDLLTTSKLKALVDAGLDTISISMYDGPEQITHFNNIREEAGVEEDNIILRRRYFEDGNYGITISNRAGLVDSNEYRDENEEYIVELPLKQKCYYPFYMTLIDYNGDMLLCPHDWNKSMVYGNLKEKHIFDLWKGKMLENIRNILSKDSRNFKPCNKCDVDGTIIGENNFKAWEIKK